MATLTSYTQTQSMPRLLTLDGHTYGFSSSLVLLTWAVWAGFILHMLLSNYLAVLMKPNFEQPIRNAADVVASNKDIFYTPRAAYIKGLFATSSDPNYAELGQNRFYIPASWPEFFELFIQVIKQNDIIFMGPYLTASQQSPKFGYWYKSEQIP